MMKVINVQEAKTHLSRLLDSVAEGDEIILGKHGKPMARLTSFSLSDQLRPVGGREGEIKMADDFDAEDPRIQAMFK